MSKATSAISRRGIEQILATGGQSGHATLIAQWNTKLIESLPPHTQSLKPRRCAILSSNGVRCLRHRFCRLDKCDWATRLPGHLATTAPKADGG